MKDIIHQTIKASADLKSRILHDYDLQDGVEQTIRRIVTSFKNKGKVLFCGNGGSAADAQHMAAELSGRFYYDRAPLFAEALHGNSSFTTAVSNDYGYDHVFERMVLASGRKDDVLVAISTSGNSQSIINALKVARDQKMITVGLTGHDGGKMKKVCDILLKVPSDDTPRIQEVHMLIGHIICQQVEAIMFPKE